MGDHVLLRTKNLDLAQFSSRPNRALSNKYIGPYPIIASPTTSAFTLRLPAHLTLHPTFHSSQLRPYLAPSINHPMIPCYTDHRSDHRHIPINSILQRRTHQGVAQYLVRWDDWSTGWIPASKLEDCHDLILEFEDMTTFFSSAIFTDASANLHPHLRTDVSKGGGSVTFTATNNYKPDLPTWNQPKPRQR